MNRQHYSYYPYPPQHYPPAAKRPFPWLRIVAALVLAGLLAAPVVAALAFFAYFQVSERILPGVHVGETRLGGMTMTQAAVELHKEWNLERRIMVTEGIHTWQAAPSELGISVDVLQTAQAAYQVGHDQDLLAEASQMLRSLVKGWGVAPVVTFDPEAARAGLQAMAPQASLAPRNASLRLEGSQLVEVPAEIGYTINVDETLAALQVNPLGVLLDGSVKVTLMPVVPAITDVSALRAEGERLINSQPRFVAIDPIYNETHEWTAPPQTVASWMLIESGAAGEPVLRFDEARIAEHVLELGAGLGQGRRLEVMAGPYGLSDSISTGSPIQLRVYHEPTTYTVEPGDTLIAIGWKVGMPYWKILQANPGLDPDALYAGQQLTIPSKDELLPLPVVPNKRIIISISRQRLWTYQDGQLRSEHVISTGIDRSPTQPGVFQVQSHELSAYASVWDLTMPHFLGIYEAWPGFMNGIHGLPTLSNGRRLWANVLGRPASYGCIILDLQAAEDLYNWAEDGVVVEIQP